MFGEIKAHKAFDIPVTSTKLRTLDTILLHSLFLEPINPMIIWLLTALESSCRLLTTEYPLLVHPSLYKATVTRRRVQNRGNAVVPSRTFPSLRGLLTMRGWRNRSFTSVPDNSKVFFFFTINNNLFIVQQHKHWIQVDNWYELVDYFCILPMK